MFTFVVVSNRRILLVEGVVFVKFLASCDMSKLLVSSLNDPYILPYHSPLPLKGV